MKLFHLQTSNQFSKVHTHSCSVIVFCNNNVICTGEEYWTDERMQLKTLNIAYTIQL